MSSPKPVIIFVGGGWTLAPAYDQVLNGLSEAGYSTEYVQLASVNPPKPFPNFEPDVSRIRSAIETSADQGHDIVLVVHSYSGVPASEAVKDFSRPDRTAQNKPGGVIRIIYFSAILLPESAHPSQTFPDPHNGYPGFVRSQDLNTFSPAREIIVERFFNDLPPQEAEKWAEKVQPQAWNAFTCALTYAAWKHIPGTYMVATEDQAAPLAAVEGLIKFVTENGAKELERRDLVGCGHYPFLSKPELCVEEIRRAIE